VNILAMTQVTHSRSVTKLFFFKVHGTVHHVSISNKPTQCSWAVTFITALLDYSTRFGRLLHPSSGAQQLSSSSTT